MAETSNDNRAARRRHAQQDLRRFVERFVDLSAAQSIDDDRCLYCRTPLRTTSGAEGLVLMSHRPDCLVVEARAWLDKHPIR